MKMTITIDTLKNVVITTAEKRNRREYVLTRNSPGDWHMCDVSPGDCTVIKYWNHEREFFHVLSDAIGIAYKKHRRG